MQTRAFRAIFVTLLVSIAQAQTACPDVPEARFPYKLANGWSAIKVAHGLQKPRHIALDNEGRLLVVEAGKGISQHAIDVSTGCITASQMLINSTVLNHGIYFSPDGLTLYASSSRTAFKWTYNPADGLLGDSMTPLVTNMSTSGHITRTLIVPPSNPDLLVISVGSDGNFDHAAVDPAIGRAIVKVFNISTVPEGGYIFAEDGWNAGYGLRNEVGLAFDKNERLWGVENSGDDLQRIVDGVATDIHVDNPAEELNYLGDVTIPNDQWYGYPTCWTVGGPLEIPDVQMTIGTQIVQAPNTTFNDATCAELSKPPVLTFQAHSAPLDSKFDAESANLFVSLHGSWNRDPPTGYKLVAVPFARTTDGTYRPAAEPAAKKGYTDIFFPTDEAACSSATCARPVGLIFDSAGRLYMTSDASGEIFLLTKH